MTDTDRPGDEHENDLQQAADELLTDPDSPDKGHDAPPPQTIDAEPGDAEPAKKRRD